MNTHRCKNCKHYNIDTASIMNCQHPVSLRFGGGYIISWRNAEERPKECPLKFKNRVKNIIRRIINYRG